MPPTSSPCCSLRSSRCTRRTHTGTPHPLPWPLSAPCSRFWCGVMTSLRAGARRARLSAHLLAGAADLPPRWRQRLARAGAGQHPAPPCAHPRPQARVAPPHAAVHLRASRPLLLLRVTLRCSSPSLCLPALLRPHAPSRQTRSGRPSCFVRRHLELLASRARRRFVSWPRRSHPSRSAPCPRSRPCTLRRWRTRTCLLLSSLLLQSSSRRPS
jgi:hypothetical protein